MCTVKFIIIIIIIIIIIPVWQVKPAVWFLGIKALVACSVPVFPEAFPQIYNTSKLKLSKFAFIKISCSTVCSIREVSFN